MLASKPYILHYTTDIIGVSMIIYCRGFRFVGEAKWLKLSKIELILHDLSETARPKAPGHDNDYENIFYTKLHILNTASNSTKVLYGFVMTHKCLSLHICYMQSWIYSYNLSPQVTSPQVTSPKVDKF